MSDAQTRIEELRELVRAFVEERNWERFHKPKDLAEAITIESSELMEHFLWKSPEECEALLKDGVQRHAIGDELADILIYCLSFANATELDISEIVRGKMERNKLRFPADEHRDRSGGWTE